MSAQTAATSVWTGALLLWTHEADEAGSATAQESVGQRTDQSLNQRVLESSDSKHRCEDQDRRLRVLAENNLMFSHLARPRVHFDRKGELKTDAPEYVLKTPDVDARDY